MTNNKIAIIAVVIMQTAKRTTINAAASAEYSNCDDNDDNSNIHL